MSAGQEKGKREQSNNALDYVITSTCISSKLKITTQSDILT